MVKKIFKWGYLIIVLAFMYAPILLLTVYSFNLSPDIGVWSENWGFDLYSQLFSNGDVLQTVVNTIVLALIASILATILGTIGAIGTFYSKRKVNRILDGVTQIPVINAEIVTAVSIALVCTMFAFGRTYASLIIGHIVLCFPFVYLSVLPKLKQLDGNLYEAALDLGASPTKALFTVIIPEILPGILSGFMMSITLSLDDYIVTTFTKPPTFDTISTYVFDAYAKGGKGSSVPALRALSAIIFLIMIIYLIVQNIVARRGKKDEKKA
ncbi:MAG: ABC transporter permease [Clostridia bacterium]|nr:ABC transporter permease [Clostridia bacterium]